MFPVPICAPIFCRRSIGAALSPPHGCGWPVNRFVWVVVLWGGRAFLSVVMVSTLGSTNGPCTTSGGRLRASFATGHSERYVAVAKGACVQRKEGASGCHDYLLSVLLLVRLVVALLCSEQPLISCLLSSVCTAYHVPMTVHLVVIVRHVLPIRLVGKLFVRRYLSSAPRIRSSSHRWGIGTCAGPVEGGERLICSLCVGWLQSVL